MNNKEITKELEEIIQSTSGCLCGHNEWCENCSPSSTKVTMIRKLRDLIDRLK
jgi:hypothetical protein